MAGWLISLMWPESPTRAANTPTPTVVVGPSPTLISSDNPIKILVLVVESRWASKPPLDACWLILFSPGTAEVFLIGFPLDTELGPHGSILDHYNKAPTLDDGAQFVQSGFKGFGGGGFAPQYTAIIDRAFIAGNVDAFGGLPIDGALLDGAALLDQHNAIPAEDYLARTQYESAALAALTEAFKQQPWSAEMLNNYYTHYQHYSADAEDLLRLAQNELPFSQITFHIELFEPTPVP